MPESRLWTGSGAIRIEDHDPAWALAYQRARATILAGLGDLSATVHHVGSTAVPGLCAKPKIDIDVEIDPADALPLAIQRMQAPERAFHGDPYGDEMWTFTEGRGSYGLRLYVCAPGNPAHERRILFRDHLRAHPDTARAYAALKLRLAVEARGDWKHYTSGKTAFVTGIVQRAAKDKGLSSPP